MRLRERRRGRTPGLGEGCVVEPSRRGAEVWVRVTREEDDAVVIVQDQGRGIPASDLPHVFEHFYRGGNAMDLAGTGLGLNAVRQIVEQHGGTIGIESDEGKGTRGTVRLPLAQTIPEESAQP